MGDTPNNRPRKKSSRDEGSGYARHSSRREHRSGFLRHRCPDVGWARADGQPYSEFTRALADDRRHGAIEPDRGEREGDRREYREQNGNDAWLSERLSEQCIHRFDVPDHDRWLHVMRRVSD